MSELADAFQATDYCVELHGKRRVLHIGAPPPRDLADWIAQYSGAVPAWLITAENPQGQQASGAANRARGHVLAQLISRDGLHALPAINRDPSGAWPDEPGWLIAGLEEGRARDLGRRFDQAALVAVTPADCALIWLDGNTRQTARMSAQRSE